MQVNSVISWVNLRYFQSNGKKTSQLQKVVEAHKVYEQLNGEVEAEQVISFSIVKHSGFYFVHRGPCFPGLHRGQKQRTLCLA